MKGIILASHGGLAEGIYNTVSMIAGEPEQTKVLCLQPGTDVTVYLNDLKQAIDSVDTGEGVTVFCDLLFGTPCNCCARLLNDSQYKDRISVITGMNLPMIIEYTGARDFDADMEEIMNAGKEGIVDFKRLIFNK